MHRLDKKAIFTSSGREKYVIPPQKLSPFIRWPLRVILIFFIYLDTLAQKMAKFWIKPPFQKKGMCKQRGTCCHNILLQWSPWYDKIPLLKKSILWWQTELNGFYVKKMEIFDEKSGTFSKVLGCRYLKKSGSCGHHFFRPSICRSWPRIEYFGLPIYLKGCGFYAKARNEKAKQWMESQQLAANKSKHKEKF